MNHIVGIHCQYMKDSGKLWDELISLDKPFSVFVVPELLVNNLESEGVRIYGNVHPVYNHYPEWAKVRFREHKDNPNITWIQEGYIHCCVKCFKQREENIYRGRGMQPDPHHEHVCVSDGSSQSLGKQLEVIIKGMRLVERELEISVKNYCPPNHLGNGDTLRALNKLDFESYITRNGFDYFTKGMVSLPSYTDKNLVVIPESIAGEGKKSPLIGAYYDRLGERRQSLDEFLKFFDEAVPLSKIVKNAGEKSRLHDWSEKLVYRHKKRRDLKRSLN